MNDSLGQAQTQFQGTPYPFAPSEGGLGILLNASTSSSRAALVGTGLTMVITNLGSVAAHLAFGNSEVTATSSYAAILPGTTATWSFPVGLSGATPPTHAAVITQSGTTQIQITRGYGV